MQTISFDVKPYVDTQNTPVRVGSAMVISGLIRIKNDYVEKLGGSQRILTSFYGSGANVILPWFPSSIGVSLVAIGSLLGAEVLEIMGGDHDITPTGYVPPVNVVVGEWTFAIWGENEALIAAYHGSPVYIWTPSLPLSSSGILKPITGLTYAVVTGGTYTYATGAVSLTTAAATGLVVGQSFTVTLTGTGSIGSLNGTWTAAAGTVGTTLNFTGPATLFLTITGGNVLTIGNAPSAVTGIFVAAPQQQVFAWGAYSSLLPGQDPLLIAWCDVGDITDWLAETTNQAGSFRLSSGSAIVSATWFGLIGLFWTDIDLWGATYVGFPLIYGFQRVAQNCGLIAQEAWAILGTTVVWMGQNDFFAYEGGAVHIIPCSVRDFVFNTIDRFSNVHADSNSYENEVIFRFAQVGASGKNNAYAKWSPSGNGAWDVWADPVAGPATPMWINAWADQSLGLSPLGVDYSGEVLRFEVSSTQLPLIDYDGLPLNSFYQTGWFYIAEGQEMVFVERIMPDFVFDSYPGQTPAGGLQMTFYFADEIPSVATDYPVRTYGPYTVTPSTPYLIIRGRGRVMSYLVSCTTAGTFWRAGKHMARVSIDGRAP